MDTSAYSKKNRNVILKRAKDYFYNNVETIRKNMRDKYKNLSEEEREKIKKYKKNCRKKMKSNITAEKKEKIKEYQKKKYGENRRLFNYKSNCQIHYKNHYFHLMKLFLYHH